MMGLAAMSVMLVMAGLCFEAGNLAIKRAVIADAADAAARAGASAVGGGKDAAYNAAVAVLQQNALAHRIDASKAVVTIEYGVWSLENETFTPLNKTQSDADAVRVNVSLPVDPIFVGKGTMKRSVQASSAVARRPTLVLVVRDAAKLGENDAEMLRRMQRWGVPTKALSASKVTPTLFNTEDLVMISSSCSSALLNGKLAAAKCAVIVCEVNNWKELGLANTYGEVFQVNLGTIDSNTNYMNIRDLPETYGFAGRRKMWDGDGAFGYGKPTGGYTAVAAHAGDATKLVAFYYEKGKTLSNGTVAPGFRGALFMRTGEDYAFKWNYTNYTWDCFDAMFAKCLPYVDNRVQLTK